MQNYHYHYEVFERVVVVVVLKVESIEPGIVDCCKLDLLQPNWKTMLLKMMLLKRILMHEMIVSLAVMKEKWFLVMRVQTHSCLGAR